jgi:phosphopantothenoylcysteine synthetase/decarboxylase
MPRFLITAGNTREMIDAVRDWGNVFTGNTGLDIARALAPHGRVDLLTSNQTHLDQLTRESDTSATIAPALFRDHASLKAALAQRMAANTYDAVFMSAAVADYRPAGAYAVLGHTIDQATGREVWIVENVQRQKIRSDHGRIAVLGQRTEKLVDLFRREWNHRGLLFKFKLEVGLDRDQLLAIGRASRTASGADYLVANTLEMVTGAEPGAFLISDAGEHWIARNELAQTLARTALQALDAH